MNRHMVINTLYNKLCPGYTYDQGLAKPLPTSPYVLVDRNISYTVNLAFLTFFSNFLNQSFEFSAQPLSIEQTLPIAMEDFSQDPNFKIYNQDSKVFPETLAQLAHTIRRSYFLITKMNFFLKERQEWMEWECHTPPPLPLEIHFHFYSL